MKEYLICRSCSFILEKKGAPALCPACGADKKAFWGYKYNLSGRRRIIMSMGIHSAILHITMAASLLIPLFIALSFFTSFNLSIRFIFAAEILVYTLPVAVAASFVSGIISGYNRFKKTGTPALRRKMILGSALIVITCAMPCNVLFASMGAAAPSLIVLSLVAVFLETALAVSGRKLAHAYIPD